VSHLKSTGGIDLVGLSAGHPGSESYLREINWQINAGERVGLVGPNGAGKTTLLLTLSGIIPPRAGEARLAGMDLNTLQGRRAVPGALGLLMQDPDDQLLEPCVEDDIALGPSCQGLSVAEVNQRVHAAIKATNLDNLRGRVPQKLSLGEKKRVALAGVLARHPQIILLDEPTAGLDPRGRRELIGLLKSLTTTLVIATHDLELVLEICHQAAVMDNGRLVASGPPAKLLADAPLMEVHGLEVPWPLRLR